MRGREEREREREREERESKRETPSVGRAGLIVPPAGALPVSLYVFARHKRQTHTRVGFGFRVQWWSEEHIHTAHTH